MDYLAHVLSFDEYQLQDLLHSTWNGNSMITSILKAKNWNECSDGRCVDPASVRSSS